MKGGKNKNSVSLSETETPPPSDAVAGENGGNSEQPLEVEEQKRDVGAEGADKEESDGEDEDVGIQEGEAEEGLADPEKPKLAEGFYEIETVRKKRIRKGKIQYLIKWRGWPETANTWEPVENLMTCYDIIDAFEESLQSGKQRSTRKHKRTHGVTHSQIKRKQQQQKHSPADATDNVPAVKVRIIEEPVPSPPLASLNVIDHVDRNGGGSNNIEMEEVANEKDLMLDSSVKEIEERNELHLKLSELKDMMETKEASVENVVMPTKETSVEKGVMVAKETSVEKGVLGTTGTSVEKEVMENTETSVDRSNNGFTSGFSAANGTESLQSGRYTGAKKRKSASVQRFKQQATSGVVKDVVANATSGHLVASMPEEIHNHGLVGNALGCNNKCDQFKDTYAITEIIKATSYLPPDVENGLEDMSVTFLAKRSDGKEVVVDNKFMKTNNPLLLISFYEKHLRHHPPQ